MVRTQDMQIKNGEGQKVLDFDCLVDAEVYIREPELVNTLPISLCALNDVRLEAAGVGNLMQMTAIGAADAVLKKHS